MSENIAKYNREFKDNCFDEEEEHVLDSIVVGKVPEDEVAVAIAFYIFMKCERPDDFCVSGRSFGGWNRIICGRRGWWASQSHCDKDFLALLKERCPWVQLQ